MPLFFSMLFLLKPISLWLWFNSYYSMWTGDWGARAKLFTIHFCHSSAFINRPGNAAKDHHSRCIPDETRWWPVRWRFLFGNQSIETQKKNKFARWSLMGSVHMSYRSSMFQYISTHTDWFPTYPKPHSYLVNTHGPTEFTRTLWFTMSCHENHNRNMVIFVIITTITTWHPFIKP